MKNDSVVIESALSKPRAHSENLVPMIQAALNYGELHARDLSGIIVSKGPGSYTGLRIGVSTAKGLAFSHNLDLVSVSSLHGLATGTLPHTTAGDIIVVGFNSRRNEVYLGMFLHDDNDVVEPLADIASLREDEIFPFISDHVQRVKKMRPNQTPNIILAGEGAAFIATCMEEANHPPQQVLGSHLVRPSASLIATLGAARHKNGLIDALDSFEPFYLNEFIPKSRKKTIFDRLPF